MINSRLEKIRGITQKKFGKASSCHDWDHVNRVYELALIIAAKEKADLNIVKAAVLLHDIKRAKEMTQNGKICHAAEGAKEAGKILKKLDFNPEFISAVCHCIVSHRYRSKTQPATIEAKILSDADKLDALGAVGIGRSLLFAGKVGARLHNSDAPDIYATSMYGQDDTFYREYMVKLRHLQNRMYTKTGRKIAKERTKYMKNFIDRLEKEIKGQI